MGTLYPLEIKLLNMPWPMYLSRDFQDYPSDNLNIFIQENVLDELERPQAEHPERLHERLGR